MRIDLVGSDETGKLWKEGALMTFHFAEMVLVAGRKDIETDSLPQGKETGWET